ncbi:hypothetical protein [uncultured Jannaschia sp.]|uniref:hypothetical protein n=1 Tax=uncultured Jannaschia sp. TaxID=293347 RepID=UPI00260CEBB1|nr:hypothetical protein [uncultured Jannaschia sp.]
MTSTTTRTLLAGAFACLATTGQAATLGLATGASVLSGTGEAFFVPGSDLSFAGLSADGADIAIAAALETGDAPGAVLVDGLLSGSVAGFGFEIDAGTDGGDVIEIDFRPDDGSLADALGPRALAVLTGEFGTDDGFAETAFFSAASVTIAPVIEVAPIPLPASGLLLVGGMAALARRRRARG